ncbi:MAG: glycosyltransferase family 4 protein [Crocinitomicaceae bacterium]|jgi:hypothetical protein
MKSVLLITHDTSISGAPKSILLVFEELIKKNIKVTTIALKGGGKLEERFKKLSFCYYDIHSLSKDYKYSIKNRFKKKFFGVPFTSEYDLFVNEISKSNFDVIYCNTVVSLNLAIELNKLIRAKLILHIHELKTVIDEFCLNLSAFHSLIDSFIVPSLLNQMCLINDFSIPKEKIFLIRETTDIVNEDFIQSRNRNNFNVLMCGGAYWRKGDDLFIQIANLILKRDKRFRFFWLGQQSDERKRVNELDVNNLGIEQYIHFIDETENIKEWYLKTDIFLLTSREDPFPLAAIDAGILGIPIFCFSKTTGIEEVINSFCVIPYLDLEIMSKRIISLVDDQDMYTLISNENIKSFNKFTPELISNQVEKLL